jgi:hypothetical protein
MSYRHPQKRLHQFFNYTILSSAESDENFPATDHPIAANLFDQLLIVTVHTVFYNEVYEIRHLCVQCAGCGSFGQHAVS